jgi:hypothetical protein
MIGQTQIAFSISNAGISISFGAVPTAERKGPTVEVVGSHKRRRSVGVTECCANVDAFSVGEAGNKSQFIRGRPHGNLVPDYVKMH